MVLLSSLIRLLAVVTLLPCFLFSSGTAEARSSLIGSYQADILRILDGDTVEARVRIWIGQTVTIRVRLRGIDAPELKASCMSERKAARKSRAALDQLLRNRTVRLTAVSGGKYHGRILADVHLQDGRSLSDIMLARKLAKPYRAPSASWCSDSPA
ncbi:thermonuclease family protein [Coralliovum pocilloporae]|uniref:thermonuclease family protein n=1 Tax=Coralliovum pocilloporae TaxID=3066369 RepID=UPI003307BE3D